MPTGTAADEDHAPLPFLPTLLARWGVSLANEPAVNVGDAPSKTNDAPPKADAPAEVDDGKEGSALFEVSGEPFAMLVCHCVDCWAWYASPVNLCVYIY